jgi:uncharacterized phage-like protein YoqJ
MEKRPLTVAFTGHRPPKIGGYNDNNPQRKQIRSDMYAELSKLKEFYDITVITGGALGVDTDAAEVAYLLEIPYIVGVPCQGHSSKWPAASRTAYEKMLSLAKEVVLVTDAPYSNDCMQIRNMWMVDRCGLLIAVWDGSSGGTANCVRYADLQKKSIRYIDPKYRGLPPGVA